MRTCPDCKVTLPFKEFNKDGSRASGYNTYCSNCNKAYHKKYNQKIRRKVLEAYGGSNPSCKCCGESTYAFLVLDHANGGGTTQRKTMKLGGTGMYQWIIRNNFPSGFRVLCANCNHANGAYGYCPHTLVVPIQL